MTEFEITSLSHLLLFIVICYSLLSVHSFRSSRNNCSSTHTRSHKMCQKDRPIFFDQFIVLWQSYNSWNFRFWLIIKKLTCIRKVTGIHIPCILFETTKHVTQIEQKQSKWLKMTLYPKVKSTETIGTILLTRSNSLTELQATMTTFSFWCYNKIKGYVSKMFTKHV